MKYKVNSTYNADINGINFNNQYCGDWIINLIAELEEIYEIEIDDYDFTLLLEHIYYEWQHNIRYADIESRTTDIIFDYLLNFFKNNIDYERLSRRTLKVMLINKELFYKDTYDNLTAFDMLHLKCGATISTSFDNELYKLGKKMGTSHCGYGEMLDVFKKRFRERKN